MADQPDWLVQTKLQPPVLHSDTIERYRPLEALRNAVTSRPVTLVSAPAGYGKTTLIASLPRLLPDLKLAWLTLDSEDNDPARFLGALIASMQRIHPAAGAGARQHLAGDPRRVVAVLINEIMEHVPQPFALVLDDLHFVTEPRVHAALDYLIERLPPQMRLVISTRHDPPLALARLIARRQVAEVRRPHLSFTPEDVRRLLNDSLGLELTAEELVDLTSRTEGWAAGLCLLASSLERITTDAGRSALLTGLAQTDRYVFDFLATEVLSNQEPSTREFLLQTSILAELTPALAEAVTERHDAGRLLEELYRKNLFLVVDESGAYRYHGLFAEFLQEQLKQEQPGLISKLHRRAAGAQPTPSRAIGHYLAAQCFDEAALAIEQAGEHLLHLGLSDTLNNWGQQIPIPVMEVHPRLASLLGRAAIGLGDYAAAQKLMAHAKDGFARAEDALHQAVAISILGSIHMLAGDVVKCKSMSDQFFTLKDLPKGILARGTGLLVYLSLHEQKWTEVVAHLRQTFELIEDAGDVGAAQANSYRLGPWLAVVPGALPHMERHCRWIESVVPPENSVQRLVLADLTATTELMRGRLDATIAAAETALGIQEQIGGYGWLGIASTAWMATIAAARGDQRTAAAHADMLVRVVEGAPPDPIQLWLYAAARVYWLIGQPEHIRRLLTRMQQPFTPKGFPMGPAFHRRLTGLLALSDGKPADAERAFREAVAIEGENPMELAPGSARVLLIHALMKQHRQEEALVELQELLRICEEREMPGLLVQEGILIAPLLQQAAGGGAPGHDLAANVLALLGHAPAAASIPGAPEPGAASAARGTAGAARGTAGAIAHAAQQAVAVLPEPLTDREREVLRLLAAGATNHEIAEALIIGDETVKTHVARILRKLDAPTRTQAAARGRELGLI